GWVPDPGLEGEVRVTVLATGFGGAMPIEPQRAAERNQTSLYNRAQQQAAARQQAENTPPAPTPQPQQQQPQQPQAQRPADAATPPPSQPEARKPGGDEIDIPAFLRRR